MIIDRSDEKEKSFFSAGSNDEVSGWSLARKSSLDCNLTIGFFSLCSRVTMYRSCTEASDICSQLLKPGFVRLSPVRELVSQTSD
jgi:hypothetical protein